MGKRFGSVEELNRAAAARKEEGDLGALAALAVENGLDREDAEDYMAGDTEELATPFLAAFGRLRTEAAELGINGILSDWMGVVTGLCEEEAGMPDAVMKKEMKGFMAGLIRFSFENKVQVSSKIVEATRITHNGKEEPLRGPLYLGVPNRAEVRRMAREYYLGEAGAE